VQDDIYIAKNDGSEIRQLTNDIYRNRAPSWSADGKSIVFYSNREGKYDVWRINFDGSGLEQLTDLTERNPWFPYLFPDGNQLAYTNSQGTFLIDLTQPIENRQPIPVAPMPVENQVLYMSALSADGSYMVGIPRSTIDRSSVLQGIVVYDIASGSYPIITDTGYALQWFDDNRRILYESSGELYVLDRVTGETRPVKVLRGNVHSPKDQFRTSFVLSYDNRTLYFTQGTVEADIWLAILR
jgi:Tol biopolymer transport system component